jgi:hypothetical protein
MVDTKTSRLVALAAVVLAMVVACEADPTTPASPLTVTILLPQPLASVPDEVIQAVPGEVENPDGSPASGIEVTWEFHDPATCAPDCVPVDAITPVHDTTDASGRTEVRLTYPGAAPTYRLILRTSDPRLTAVSADTVLIGTVFPGI